MSKASTLGKIDSFYIEEGVQIPITKYDAGYSDTLNIYIGNTWIKRVEGLKNGDTVLFEQAEIENIYNTMSNVSRASFRFHNTTYNKANIVGTSETYALGTISTNIKPSVSSLRVSESVTGLATQFQGYVQSKSKLNVTIEATAGTGSEIASYETKIGSHIYTGNSFTTNALTDSGEVTITTTVTDKRGRSDSLSLKINVFEYDSPKVTVFNAVRCKANGVTDVYGEYVKLNVDAYISPVNNKNNKTFKIEYKQKSATSWTTLRTYQSAYSYTITDGIYSGFSSDYAYDFRITCTDYFVNGVQLALVPSGFAMIDLKANGKGIAFGKVSSKDALEIGMPIFDQFDTGITNGVALYNDGDPDTTLEELILTGTNVPGIFNYVRTIFSDEKSVTAARTQIALPYSFYGSAGQTSVYVRSYIPSHNEWTEWRYLNNEITSATHTGIYTLGNMQIETGKLVITPVANTPTGVNLTFKNTYKNSPVVFATASTNWGGQYVLDTSPHIVSTTGTTIYLTRTNTVATNVFYIVIGEV